MQKHRQKQHKEDRQRLKVSQQVLKSRQCKSKRQGSPFFPRRHGMEINYCFIAHKAKSFLIHRDHRGMPAQQYENHQLKRIKRQQSLEGHQR